MTLDEASDLYFEVFGKRPNIFAFGVEDDYMVEVLTDRIKRRDPLPVDYDWHAGFLPKGADA
jgi:hypothetical protein